MSLEAKTLGALAASASSIPGSITVATITTPASGIAGILGFTATTAVTLPLAGVVAASAVVGYGVYKGVQAAKKSA